MEEKRKEKLTTKKSKRVKKKGQPPIEPIKPLIGADLGGV
jgi:hypothetical protein